jgi:thiol-disulfide isomerase/thioredoxin
MELHYSGQGHYEYDGGSSDSASDWKLWVVRENDDGSWRIIVRHASVYDSKDVSSPNADVRLAYLDLFADGRFAENDSFGYRMNPHALFARLPANENLVRNGWQSRVEESDTTYQHTAAVADLKPSVVWDFVRVEDSPETRIYQLSRESTFSFARGKGAMQRVETRSKQASRAGGATDRIEIQAIMMREPAWIDSLERDMARYVDAEQRHSRLVERLHRAVADAENRLNAAAKVWTDLRDEVTNDEVRDAVNRRIAQDESWRTHRLEDAKRLAAVLGQTAPAWEALDLAGATHRLADYQGKIVVLDFWYRGCGWCIRAMPQVNQIAAEFSDAPVAVLGMNTDAKIEDARFVENEMRLKYPNLRIDKELPKSYGVRGFPTLVILDQNGVIRDIHVGYATTLRADVAKSIRLLLDEIGPDSGASRAKSASLN